MSKVKKIVKKLKKFAPIALSIAGNSIAPGIGGAIGSAVGTKVSGGSWGDALKSGALSYAGGKIGGAIGKTDFGKSIGLGGSVGDAIGLNPSNLSINGTGVGGGFALPGGGAIDYFGPSNVLGGTSGILNDIGLKMFGGKKIFDNNIGEALGSYTANSMSDSQPKPLGGPAPFQPKQEAEQDAPSSLSAFGALSPDQESTNLATQGVYGGGLGPQEQSYFVNMINRRLVDESGRADANLDEVKPIENSYLSQLGLGGYSNSKDLLEAMKKWRSQ